jgi:diadenylate cyclase
LLYTEFLERLYKFSDLLELGLLFVIVYAALKFLRGRRAQSIAAGLTAFLLLLILLHKLSLLEELLRVVLIYLPIFIILLFLPEIREAFISLGDLIRYPRLRRRRDPIAEGVYEEIVGAAMILAEKKTGALIIIERDVSLRNVTKEGVPLNADITQELLVTIFNRATPLHDGAVVVRGHRAVAAACFTRLTMNSLIIDVGLGSRHRAAIGVTEDTDAVAVVISEETGRISFTEGGHIFPGLSEAGLRSAIYKALAARGHRAEKIQPTRDEHQPNQPSTEA